MRPLLSVALLSAVVSLHGAPARAIEWQEEAAGKIAAWDAAHDPATGVRFIPIQLIIPSPWNGHRTIDRPPADFVDFEGERWSGPSEDKDAFSGKPIAVYTRVRRLRTNYAEQRFAIRAEQDGIGRVYDSRFGEIFCSGEIKFPLGTWRQGETRRNEYSCFAKGGKPKRRINTITIEKIDFVCHGGIAHCLQFTWTHEIEGRDKPVDDRRYIFAPGFGSIAHDRR